MQGGVLLLLSGASNCRSITGKIKANTDGHKVSRHRKFQIASGPRFQLQGISFSWAKGCKYCSCDCLRPRHRWGWPHLLPTKPSQMTINAGAWVQPQWSVPAWMGRDGVPEDFSHRSLRTKFKPASKFDTRINKETLFKQEATLLRSYQVRDRAPREQSTWTQNQRWKTWMEWGQSHGQINDALHWIIGSKLRRVYCLQTSHLKTADASMTSCTFHLINQLQRGAHRWWLRLPTNRLSLIAGWGLIHDSVSPFVTNLESVCLLGGPIILFLWKQHRLLSAGHGHALLFLGIIFTTSHNGTVVEMFLRDSDAWCRIFLPGSSRSYLPRMSAALSLPTAGITIGALITQQGLNYPKGLNRILV